MNIERDVPALFTIEECCKILNCSRTHLNKLLKSGALASVRLGRSRRITESQLVSYIKMLEEGS